ncbi:MAG: polysaccharide biosynthesis protein [Puniceicoccales bacterium]|jgi:FlaA1/EpsC-like NDP-sugar epimerase|nr:polysaccharide biosynthesis protein [Puniceicoccales bacterium]
MLKLFTYSLKLGVYSFCLASSIAVAYVLKYEFTIPLPVQNVMWYNICMLVPVKIIALVLVGEFKGIFSYFRLPDLVKIASCFSVISFVFLLSKFCVQSPLFPSREIILADLLFSILFILFFRTSLRIINNYGIFNKTCNIDRPETLNVVIVGTHEAGSNIITELKSKRFYGITPVGVVDDDSKYYGRTLHEIPVLGPPECLRDCKEHYKIEGMVLISQSLSIKRLNELAQLARELNLKLLTIPSFGEFLEGHAFATRLRTLDVEDFLERKPVHLNLERSTALIANRVVAITGAGGSIGRELSKQIAIKYPSQLILMDHSEYNLFKIEQDLLHEGLPCTPVLIDISNAPDVESCLQKYHPHLIYHAAAYKHVPLLENQSLVALKNNALGTGILAKLASKMKVEKFILISTDKAINPINNMGASKRIAEMLCMALQHQTENRTQFMAVRFGNVLGSAGSVLPIFKEQIARGGPITVTHPQMTRFFMTIPEAVGLILEASSFESVAGKTFVLDMGSPVKILDVAKKMIELNNLRVGTDIEIIFTGIRPGEKLHEDLVYNPDYFDKTINQHIWLTKDPMEYLSCVPTVDGYLKEMEKLSSEEESIRFIRTLIPNFKM